MKAVARKIDLLKLSNRSPAAKRRWLKKTKELEKYFDELFRRATISYFESLQRDKSC